NSGGPAKPGDGSAASQESAPEIPRPDTSVMEPLVAELIEGRIQDVEKAPASAEAWADLGFALDAHMLLEEAETCLGYALELDDSLFPAAYDHAFLGVLLPRDPDDVSDRFQRATELQPDYGPVLVRHGDHLLESGEVVRATERFEAALEVSPTYEYAQLGLGRCLMESDDPEDLKRAEALLAPLFELYPGDPALATAYGQSLALLERGEEAARVATEHAQAFAAGTKDKVPMRDSLRGEILSLSRSAASNYQRGEKLLRRSDFKSAAREFERVLGVDPNNRPARVLLADTRIALRELDAARAELGKLLEQDPRDPAANALLGQLDTEAAQYESALRHFQVAGSSRTPMDTRTFRAWVTALGSLRRWDEALFRIDEWIRAIPLDPEPYYLRAMAQMNSGDLEAARASLAVAESKNPNHPLRTQLQQRLAR
ncbi:MAG: tetratricopeptide repeat protein, partial [Planctomycetota bacterium]